MFDVALSSAGAQVSIVTACDENFPPENMIDGQLDSFWISTGLFPQEFVLTFQGLMNITSISMDSTAVRHLTIERSVQNEPVDFEIVTDKEFENMDQSMQSQEIPMDTTATHLRFCINSAYDHFVSVHKIKVDGNAVHN